MAHDATQAAATDAAIAASFGVGGAEGGLRVGVDALRGGEGATTAANAMRAMVKRGIASGTDCSEIAESLCKTVGDGKILRLEPRQPGRNLRVQEHGEEVRYLYHEVYVRRGYVYDPRWSPNPVRYGSYMRAMHEANPGMRVSRVKGPFDRFELPFG
jgi:hypothetical protein